MSALSPIPFSKRFGTRLTFMVSLAVASCVIAIGAFSYETFSDSAEKNLATSRLSLNEIVTGIATEAASRDANSIAELLNDFREASFTAARLAEPIFSNVDLLKDKPRVPVELTRDYGPLGMASPPDAEVSTFVTGKARNNQSMLDELAAATHLDVTLQTASSFRGHRLRTYLNSDRGFTRMYPGEDFITILYGSDPPPAQAKGFDHRDTTVPHTSSVEERDEALSILTDVYDDPAGLGLTMTSITRIMVDGKRRGNVGIDMTLSTVLEILSTGDGSGTPDEDSYTMILMNDGRAVAVPDEGYTDFLGSLPEGRGGEVRLHARNPEEEVFYRNVREHRRGTHRLTTPRGGILAAIHPVGKTSWCVVSVRSLAPIEQVIAELEKRNKDATSEFLWHRLVPFGSLFLVLGVALSLLLTRRVTRPLMLLNRASLEVARGNLNIELRNSTSSEIGRLSTSFHNMALALKESYSKLHESELQYNILTATLPCLVYRCLADADYTCLFVSSYCKELCGYEPEAFAKGGEVTWEGTTHPEDRSRVRETVDQAISMHNEFVVEYRIIHKSGDIRWVREHGRPERGISEDGYPIIDGAIFDITPTKEADNALRDQRQTLGVTLDNIADGVMTMSRDQVVTQANAIACDIVGMGRERLIGRSLDGSLIPHEEDANVLRDILAGESVKETRLNIVSAVHGSLPVSILAKALRDERGQYEGSVIVIRDRRNEEMTRRRLEEAERMETVARLAGGIAHDFNNLLTIILGYAKVLQDSHEMDDPAQRQIYYMQDAAERAAALTRKLLAFSRKQVLRPRALDVNHELRSLLPALGKIGRSALPLHFDPCNEQLEVLTDPAQLAEVMHHVIENAFDATPPDGMIQIATRFEDVRVPEMTRFAHLPVGHFAVIEVKDTGRGMSEEVLSRAFEPFFTTKSTTRGAGLGLSTVVGIIKQSGGEVTLESTPSKGTTVSIYLPILAISPEEAAESVDPQTPNLSESQSVNGDTD